MSSEQANNTPSPAPVKWQPASSGKIRLEAVDGLRALAMLMVYTYHVWQFGDSPALRLGPISFGSIIGQFPSGVDLFMVLSGFCLFWPLVFKPQNLNTWSTADYSRRRIRRIVPPYYAAIVFVILQPLFLKLIFHALGKTLSDFQWPSLWQLVTHLTFTHTLFPSTWKGLQGTFWSLGLEAQFYLVFPLVVLAVRKWGTPRTTSLMILTSVLYRIIAAMIIGDRPFPALFLPSIIFLGRWMQFAAGMLAAYFVAARIRENRKLSPTTGLLALAAALVLYSIAVSPPIQRMWLFPCRDLLLAVGYAIGLVALCASHSLVNMIFENRVIAGLGFISYSVFLIHQNTVYYFGELLKKFLHLDGNARFALMMTVGFLAVVGISYLFFLLFEKPFLNQKRAAKRTDHQLLSQHAQVPLLAAVPVGVES